MIVTVTLNPSMDYLYTIEHFKLGMQNRFENPVKMVGGKGINAGRTAKILGSKVILTGVLAGKNGEEVRNVITEAGFNIHFLDIQGETRNAITIMHDNGIQTEIVEAGPIIDKDIESRIVEETVTMCQQFSDVEVICLSGSANSQNENLYQHLINSISSKMNNKIKILTDISGKQLMNVLQGGDLPFFIKPNIYEFSDLIGVKLSYKEEALRYLDHELIRDVPLVIISCGKEGGIAKYQKLVYDLKVPKIDLVNPTGSGDATVGGVAYGLDNKFPIETVLKYGMACGVANAMEQGVGVVNPEVVHSIMKKIELKKLSVN